MNVRNYINRYFNYSSRLSKTNTIKIFYLNFLLEKMAEGVRPDSLEKLQLETSQPTQVIESKRLGTYFSSDS